jgi:antitoxin ParD1/3/4
MPSMNISLTSELMQLVQSKVESGLYNNASEVIREAIRQMDSNAELLTQLKLARLKEALAAGIKQAEKGDVAPLSLNELLSDLNDPSHHL